MLRSSRVTVSPLLVFAVCLGVYLGYGREVLSFLLCVLAHEAAHLAAMRMLRMPLRRVRFSLFGAVIETDAATPSEEALAAAAGPAANLFLSAVLRRVWPAASRLSFGLCLYNLLPLWPLDGGRMLRAFLNSHFPRSAAAAEKAVAVLTGLVLLGGGLTLCVHGEGIFPPAFAAAVLFRAFSLARKENGVAFPVPEW